MHPAASVILFTVTSGMGYGLLALLAVLGSLGALPPDPGLGLAGLGVALALITIGLLASTFHLGHPERAWRALSQWRTSWLSREGVLAILSYPPALVFAGGWVLVGRTDGVFALAGWLTALLAVVTVCCTAMIYASLKPIPQWRNRWVMPGYVALALATGAVWLALLAGVFGVGRGAANAIAMLGLVVAALVKLAYWRHIDTAAPIATAADAIGLGGIAQARLLERPHTEENYLQKEMGFRVARKHADRLRRLVLIGGFGLPLALVVLASSVPAAASVWLLALALAGTAIGALVERWLFFAQAKHTVTLYYGAATV
ncbi:MAG TPA: DmsC/YnfH family molybdoenzyme membrane anchor subunit [Immundisolibacter sp.]